MKKLTELMADFEAVLINTQSPILRKLKAGLASDVARKYFRQIGINEDTLINLYSWKNGLVDFEKSIIGEMELFPDGIMLSLEEAKNVYNIYTHQKNLWQEKFFPIFTNGGGAYLVFDFDNKSETYEMFLLYDPALFLGVEPITIYDSMETLIRTQVECLTSHAYNFNSKGIDDINYDLLSNIALKNNPKSKYWDDYR